MHDIVLRHQQEENAKEEWIHEPFNFTREKAPERMSFFEVEESCTHTGDVKENRHSELNEESVACLALLFENGVVILLLFAGYGDIRVIYAMHNGHYMNSNSPDPIYPENPFFIFLSL